MLNILRKRAQSTFIQAVVLIIAVVFVFWGVGTNIGNKRNLLATVNGEEIPYQDFQRSYDSAVENLRVQFGGSIPQGFLEGLNMNRQVLNQLIQAEILRQGGNKMGITVSKLATQDEIKDMDVFQTNGQFDLNRYKEILSQNRMTPTSFEASFRNDLLARKVNNAIRGFAEVTDNQVHLRFAYSNEEIKLAYVAFRSEDMRDKVEINEEELSAWFEQHKNEYLTDPMIRLQYLFFGYDDDLSQVTVNDDVIKAQYEADIDKYSTPEKRHASHILFRVAENDDAQVRSDKKKKAEEVLKLAQEGEDFAELAQQYSEGPTAPKGGDLGFFSRGAMVESFDDAVFQMQPGDISGVVETIFGFHIIKLEEIRPAATRPFEEVRDEVAAQIRQKEVVGVTFQRASKAYEDIIRAGSLEKYKNSQGENVEQTDYFSQNEPSALPVSDPKFMQVAFSLKKGELSSLVETGKGYAILFVDDIKEPEAPQLNSVREKVEADYRKSKSLDLARDKAETMLKDAREKKSLADAVTSEITITESDFIRRSDPASAGEVPAQVVQQAFTLTLDDALPEQPVAMGDTFYLFELLERKQGEQSLEENKRDQLRDQLKSSVQNELMTGWLAWMQSKADIWINEQIIQ